MRKVPGSPARVFRRIAAAAMALALLGLPVSAPAAAKAGEPLCRRVIVIGVDGMGAFLEKTEAPNYHRIFDGGSRTLKAKAIQPTNSAQGWGCMFYGVRPEVHGRTNASVWRTQYSDPELPSIFRLVTEAYPGNDVASIVGWSPINYGIIDHPEGMDMIPDTRIASYRDHKVMAWVREYLKDHDPRLLFIHLNDADSAGHRYGFGSDRHLKALETVDAYIGAIYSALEERGMLKDTLILLVTDHGGTPHGHHGGSSAAEIECLFAAAGPGVCRGGTVGEMDLTDIGPIVLYALGIEPPAASTGKVPPGLFDAADLDLREFLVVDEDE